MITISVVRNLLVRCGADFSELQKEMNKAQKYMASAGKQITSIGKTLTLGITAPIIGIGAASVKAASDLEETNSKFNAVFGDMADSVSEFAKSFSNEFGRSTQEVKENLSVIQTVGKNYGLTADEASGLSKNMLTLANDVAAFTNTDLSDTANRMTAALRGEGEAAEILNFSINQTTLAEYARSKGITQSISKMTQAELVNLRYGLMVEQAADMTGYATKEQDSFTAQLARAKGVLTDLAGTMGIILLPAITNVIIKINEFIQKNSKWITSNAETIVNLLAVAAAIGPVILVIGKLTSGLASVLMWGKGVSGALAAVKAGTSGVGAIFTAVFGPGGIILLIIAGIALVVGAFIYLWNNCDAFRNFFLNMWAAIGEFLTPILTAIRDYIVNTWNDIWDTLKPILESLKETIITTWNYVWQTLQPVIESLKVMFVAAWEFIKAATTVVWDFIKTYFGGIFDAIKVIFDAFVSVIKWVWTNFGDIIVQKFKTAWDMVVGIFNGVVKVITGIFDFLTGALTGNWEKCWEGIKGVVVGVWEAIKSVVKGGINFLIGAINGFIRGVNKVEVPDWIPFAGGKSISIPEIPYLAKGTDYFQGGLAIVGEEGPELVSMPTGAKVTPNGETMDMLGNKQMQFNFIMDGRQFARVLAKYNGEEQATFNLRTGGAY